MNTFNHGQKVRSITWPDDTFMSCDNPNVESMSISMETGHMANLAFVRVDYSDGSIGMEYTANVYVVLEAPTDKEDGDE